MGTATYTQPLSLEGKRHCEAAQPSSPSPLRERGAAQRRGEGVKGVFCPPYNSPSFRPSIAEQCAEPESIPEASAHIRILKQALQVWTLNKCFAFFRVTSFGWLAAKDLAANHPLPEGEGLDVCLDDSFSSLRDRMARKAG